MTKVLITLFIIFSIVQNAKAGYDVDDNCKTAWMLLMDLKINEAKQLLKKEIQQNPDNYYAYYLDQTCDAYALIINSDEDEYKAFLENYDKRRTIMDDKDTDSPYYLACLAEMQLQVGIFNILNGDRLSGLRKAYSSYNNTYKNLNIFPGFKQSLKLDGFFNVAISNVPPFVKWAVSFFGVSANPSYGFKVLNENYESQQNIKGINAESALFVILTAKLNKTPNIVYNFTKSLDSAVSGTFLHKYFKANIAYRIGKNEEALSTLQQININDYPYVNIIYSYLMGKILLRKLDINAGFYLESYLKNLKKEEYIKEINYKLALFYLINNKPARYDELCRIVQNEGNDVNERDREALYDAQLDYKPDVNLIKAKLLLDGGYYDKSAKALAYYAANSDSLLAHKLEYIFLNGRLNVENNNVDLAIKQFKEVINIGVDEDYYFASEAALRLGFIYENKGDDALAIKYFNKSEKLYKSSYYEYIYDKAAKGINRLSH